MKTLHEKKQETYENAYENRIWAGKPFWGSNQPNQSNQSDESQPKKGDFAAKLLEVVPDPSRQEPAPAVFLQIVLSPSFSHTFPQVFTACVCWNHLKTVMIFPWHSNILKVNFKWLHIDRNCKPPQQGHLIIINFHKSYENHIKSHYPNRNFINQPSNTTISQPGCQYARLGIRSRLGGDRRSAGCCKSSCPGGCYSQIAKKCLFQVSYLW